MTKPTGPNNRLNSYYQRINNIKIARDDENRTAFLNGGPITPPTVTLITSGEQRDTLLLLTAIGLNQSASSSRYVVTLTPQPGITGDQIVAGTDASDNPAASSGVVPFSITAPARWIELPQSTTANVYIYVQLISSGNNRGGIEEVGPVLIDTVEPAYVSAVPAGGSTNVPINTSFELEFSKPLLPGTAQFGIFDIETYIVTEAFTASDGVGDDGGTITVNGNLVLITPGKAAQHSNRYSILWAEGAVLSQQNVPVAENSNGGLYQITTAPASTIPPVVLASSWDDTAKVLTIDVLDDAEQVRVYWAGTTAGATPSEAEIIAGFGPGINEAGSHTRVGDGTDVIDLNDVDTVEIQIVVENSALLTTGQPDAANNTVLTGVTVTPPVPKDFIMTVETTAVDETFTIPCQDAGVFDAHIEWGDGQVSNIVAFDDPDLTHVYATPGTHTINITGTFPNIFFNAVGDKDKVRTVEQLGDVGWDRLTSAFDGCSGLTSFNAGVCDTSAVISMSRMLRDCAAATFIDVTPFDTSACTNMGSMFRECSAATNLDPSGFNIGALNSDIRLNLFAANVTIPTDKYDATLIAWEAQAAGIPVQSPDFGNSQYTPGGAAETARNALINTHGWTISDGGAVAPSNSPILLAELATTATQNDIQTPEFVVPAGYACQVVVAHTSNTTALDPLTHGTLGDKDRPAGPGSGQDYSDYDVGFRSRNNGHVVRFEDPANTPQTFRCGASGGAARSWGIQVWAVPGSTGPGTQDLPLSGSNRTALGTWDSVADTTLPNTWLCFANCFGDNLQTVQWAGDVDIEVPILRTGDTGGPSQETGIATAWKLAAAPGSYTASATFSENAQGGRCVSHIKE